MKALTVLQPFAGLIACGEKTIETRTWPTKYRGQLLICSGKRPHGVWKPQNLARLAESAPYKAHEPKPGMIVTVVATELDLQTAFGGTYRATTSFRKGQVVELVRPGINTSWSWIVKEGDVEFPYSINLNFLRPATQKEIDRYHAMLLVVD